MTPLEKARQAVVEAEYNLCSAWPSEGLKICANLNDGNDFVVPKCGVNGYQYKFILRLLDAREALHAVEMQELDAHRRRVLINNAKVSGQAASSAA